jgi:hypothetical protein
MRDQRITEHLLGATRLESADRKNKAYGPEGSETRGACSDHEGRIRNRAVSSHLLVFPTEVAVQSEARSTALNA